MYKYTESVRRKYHTDPVHRRKILNRNAAWRKANPEKEDPQHPRAQPKPDLEPGDMQIHWASNSTNEFW